MEDDKVHGANEGQFAVDPVEDEETRKQIDEWQNDPYVKERMTYYIGIAVRNHLAKRGSQPRVFR